MKNRPIILIIDDTPENLNVLGNLLEKKYDIRVATNGFDALEIVKTLTPDLILLDIMMPNMDGYEVCKKLKANPNTKIIPVIFISALDASDQKIKAFREGAVDYITKPFQTEEVEARIHTHIQLSKLEDLKREIDERKLVELALLKSEERYRFLIENATFPIIVATFTGEILYVNNCTQEFFDVEKGYLDHKMTTDFWVNKNERNEFITELNQNGAVDNKEIELYTNGNKIKTVILSSKVIDYENKTAIFTIFNDITERKQVEETLKKSEEKFSKAFNTCPVSITISTLENGKYVEVNDSFIKVSGFTKEEVLGYSSADLHLWVQNEKRDQFYNNLSQRGFIRDFPAQFRMKNSTVRDFILASEIIELHGKKHILNYSIDVTERKRAEAELREKDLRIRASFDLSFEFIGLLSVDGTLIEVNQTAMNFAGIKLNDVIGKPFWETPWWNHSIEEQQKLKDAIGKSANGETITYEATHRASDGELHYIDFSLKPLKNDKNEVKYLIPEGRDITNIKRANDELIKREHFLQTLINTIPDLIWLKNSDGVYLQCNKRFEDFFGAKEKNIVGKTDYDFVDKELADFFREHDNKAMNAEKPTINEELVPFADGHCEFLETIKMSIYDSDKTIIGVLGIGRDITERKQVEEKIKESEEKYRYIVENSPIGIFQRKIDDAGNYNYFNPALIRDFECNSYDEFIQNYADVNKRFAIPEKIIEFNDLLNNNNIVENFEVKTILKNGKTKWFSIFAKLERSNSFINGFSIDNTEKKNIEKALMKSEQRLQTLLHSVTDYMYSVKIENGKAIETYHGEGCFPITGYTSQEFKNDSNLWFNIVFNLDKSLVDSHIDNLINKKYSEVIEHRIVHKNGSIRWIRNTPVLKLDSENEVIGYDGLISDITEEKKLQHQIITSVIETEEKERLHFSQELHDGIGPLLSATKMYIQLLESHKSDENSNNILQKVEKLLDESSSTIREISFKLSPHILQNYGLIEALKAYVEKIKETAKIEFHFQYSEICKFNEKAEIIIYRVLCECTNNTLKYAKATQISIDMYCENNQLIILYSDNGKGFDTAIVHNNKGIGILNMQSRINSINGKMEITSNENNGTEIKFQVDICSLKSNM